MRKKYAGLLTLTLIVAILAGIGIIANYRNKNIEIGSALAAEIVLEPTAFDSAGVDTASLFMIKTTGSLDPKEVREKLEVDPAFSFDVNETGNSTQDLMVVPKESLEPNRI